MTNKLFSLLPGKDAIKKKHPKFLSLQPEAVFAGHFDNHPGHQGPRLLEVAATLNG